MRDDWFAREMICDQNRVLGFTEFDLNAGMAKKGEYICRGIC